MALLNTNIGPERVQVFPQPIGNVQIAGASTSVTAFMIHTTLVGAPVNVPTKVQTLDEFVTLFGGADDVSFDGYYAVKGFYDNAGSGAEAVIVNVAGTNASDFVGNSATGTGIRALDPIDDLGLICAPGLPLEKAYLVDAALIDYAETVRAEYGATLSTMMSILAIPKEVTKANSDVAASADLTVDTVVGQVVTFSGTPDLSVVTPGMIVKKAATIIGTVTAVDDTLKTLTLTSVTGLVALDVAVAYTPSAVSYKDSVVNNPAITAAWYFNNPVVLDEATLASPGATTVVSPVGHVAGVMARIDQNIAIGGVSHAPAGIKYAGLGGIIGLNLSLSERLDGEPLRLAFINRITSFPGLGNVIFGGYTAGGAAVTADEQLIQVIRSVQYIKASLEAGLKGFLWENFSPETQAQVNRAIDSFMQNNIYLFPAGLPQAQQYKVIAVEATQNDIDQGLLKVIVQIKPNKAVRFIEIALQYPIPTA